MLLWDGDTHRGTVPNQSPAIFLSLIYLFLELPAVKVPTPPGMGQYALLFSLLQGGVDVNFALLPAVVVRDIPSPHSAPDLLRPPFRAEGVLQMGFPTVLIFNSR